MKHTCKFLASLITLALLLLTLFFTQPVNATSIIITKTFYSTGAQDGWVLESTETSNKGGTLDATATTFRLGDDNTKKQYRGILSFNTSSLPDDAVITKVTLKVKRQGVTGGGNPVTTFQGFMLDIKKGFFGTAALQTSDFQAAASKSYGPFMTALGGGWYSIDLTSGKGYINKFSTLSGLTQIRLRFKLDDNNNAVANVLSLFSGNAPAASRPRLIIQYTATPVPQDVPVYRNSFEGITDLAASGITSNANIRITTQNVDYASGSKTLEVYGTLPGAQWSSLTADFSMKKFIGEDTLDLSDKTIGYSVFIPNDSPINIVVFVAQKGDIFVNLGAATAYGGWVDVQYDVEEAYQNGSWSYTNGSDEEARDVIKHCETISIQGVRSTAGTSAEANFYFDNLNWIRNDRFNLPLDDSIDSLRKYAADKHFKFGLFTASFIIFGPEDNPDWHGDPWYAYTAAQEGVVNVVWGFSWKPNENYTNFDYDCPEDAGLLRQYQFGEGNHMTIMGYGIGSLYNQAPQWIRDLAFPDATQAFLLYHIEKDLQYTKGKNPVWFLFNEAVQSAENSMPTGLKNRQGPSDVCPSCYSPWAANIDDSSLIKAAFIKAREVDPSATLMLNDGGAAEVMGKSTSDFYYQFASDLKTQGIPIDGVGFQTHNYIDPDGKLVFYIPYSWPWEWEHMTLDVYLQKVDANVKRYASKGLKVGFTEVDFNVKIGDIDFNTEAGRVEYGERLEWQAKYYAGLLKIALENENVIVFHSWMVTDRYPDIADSRFADYGNGAIFDKNYNPKPAYYAMLELLKAP